MIESVISQIYANWELCIADGNSKEQDVREILQVYANKNNRINIRFLQENKGIVGNSNEALSASAGDFVTFLDHDDKLSPFALYEIVNAINKNQIQILFILMRIYYHTMEGKTQASF